MRYIPDRSGIRGYLQGDADLRRELTRRGQLGLAYAKSVAPRGRTGELRNSGHLESPTVRSVANGTPRLVAEIVFDVDYAASVEFGNNRTRRPTIDPPRHFLQSATAIVERG